ncbi:MAG: twin-arginine translocase subunit TatC [Verrucomicrobiales bacterium]
MLKTVFEKLFQMRENASRARPGADDGYDAHEKPFLDHLEDLRKTLMQIGATLAVFTVLCFAFHTKIFELIQIPVKLKIAEIAPGVTLWEKLDLITLRPPEFILLMLKLSFFSGVILSFPLTVYFLFQFILPGLRQAEKKTVIPGALVGFALFLVGVAFAFFLAAPIALKFFYIFELERISNIDPVQQALNKPISELALIGVDGTRIPPIKPDGPAPEPPEAGEAGLTPEMRAEIRDYLRNSFATMESANFALRFDEAREKMVIVEAKGGRSVYQIGEYVSFIARLVLVFGISFQLPVVVTILVKLELLTARVMRSTRTYAWIIILVAAAILTPPDLMTLALLGGPMVFLYEICILIASFIERRREKREMAEANSRRDRLALLYEKPADELSEEEKEEMHRAEVEQYEREHAHLYEEESAHAADESEDHDQHDESWHDNEHHWHDGHEGHEDDPHSHDHDDTHTPIQDWPDKPGEGMESDHAEPVDLEPGEDPHEEDSLDGEVCEPSGPVIDANHATIEELKTLPGIGPKLAEAIVDHRPYETFDDLEKVPGLSQDKINKMVDRLMLG